MATYSLESSRQEAYSKLSISNVSIGDYVVATSSVKAVSQTPAAGTLLAAGATVVVYFEDTDSMSISIIDGVHAGYKDTTIKKIVDEIEANDPVQVILDKKKKWVELTVKEKEVMTAFFTGTLHLDLVEADATRTEQAAYEGVVAAYTLK